MEASGDPNESKKAGPIDLQRKRELHFGARQSKTCVYLPPETTRNLEKICGFTTLKTPDVRQRQAVTMETQSTKELSPRSPRVAALGSSQAMARGWGVQGSGAASGKYAEPGSSNAEARAGRIFQQ